jgi:hypothetical protein
MEVPTRFGVNVCCSMPRRSLPYGVGDPQVESLVTLSLSEFRILAELLVNKYISRPNYAQCKGRAILTFYHVAALIAAYVVQGIKDRLELLRRTASKRGVSLWIVALFSALNAWRELASFCMDLPFDAYSSYIALPDFDSSEPLQDFRCGASKWLSHWALNRAVRKPVYPCVGAGWNASARGTGGYEPARDGLRFPYHPVIVGDTPQAFEWYLRQAASGALFSRDSNDLLFLGPWNEWSEGAYLLPDTRFGNGKLAAVLEVKRMLRALVS